MKNIGKEHLWLLVSLVAIFLARHNVLPLWTAALMLAVAAGYFIYPKALEAWSKDSQNGLTASAYLLVAIGLAAVVWGLYRPSRFLKTGVGLVLTVYMIFFFFRFRVSQRQPLSLATYREIMWSLFLTVFVFIMAMNA
ncbi:MAG: hypothetical protein GXO24_06290 [Chlorobi bacterium]|nr:hypothetical protein [Chlorobiota bacterium]